MRMEELIVTSAYELQNGDTVTFWHDDTCGALLRKEHAKIEAIWPDNGMIFFTSSGREYKRHFTEVRLLVPLEL